MPEPVDIFCRETFPTRPFCKASRGKDEVEDVNNRPFESD
jgi:hypothetical protein